MLLIFNLVVMYEVLCRLVYVPWCYNLFLTTLDDTSKHSCHFIFNMKTWISDIFALCFYGNIFSGKINIKINQNLVVHIYHQVI